MDALGVLGGLLPPEASVRTAPPPGPVTLARGLDAPSGHDGPQHGGLCVRRDLRRDVPSGGDTSFTRVMTFLRSHLKSVGNLARDSGRLGVLSASLELAGGAVAARPSQSLRGPLPSCPPRCSETCEKRRDVVNHPLNVTRWLA